MSARLARSTAPRSALAVALTTALSGALVLAPVAAQAAPASAGSISIPASTAASHSGASVQDSARRVSSRACFPDDGPRVPSHDRNSLGPQIHC